MRLANLDIRTSAKRAGVPLWAVAQAQGISEATLTRKLRTELPETEREKIQFLIKQLGEEAAHYETTDDQ